MRITELIIQTIKLSLVVLIFYGVSYAQNDDLSEINDLVVAKNYDEALDATDELIEETPDDPKLHFLKATILEKFGDMSGAIKIYQHLTKNFPTLPEPFNNLAIHQANNGDYQAAITTLEAAFNANKSYATTYKNLQAIYNKLASDSYRIALNSTSPESALELAALQKVTAPALDQSEILNCTK